MAWPTDDLDTTDLDAGTDSPSSARADLLALMQKVQAILAQRGVASGICDLDATNKVPVARIPQGAGSGLDADTVDGLSPTSAATANTVASRDASGNSAFAMVNTTTLGLTHAAATRNTDTVFYSSGGSTVNKNTGAGMRASLEVYSKIEVDNLLAAAGDLELISSSVGFSSVTAVEFTGDYSAYSSLLLVADINPSLTPSTASVYFELFEGGSWRTSTGEYRPTNLAVVGLFGGSDSTPYGVVRVDVSALDATMRTGFKIAATSYSSSQGTNHYVTGGFRFTPALLAGVRLRIQSGSLNGSAYLYGRKL